MITYELAKQLNDNGFPQKVVEIPKHNFDGHGCYLTLSELIDACPVENDGSYFSIQWSGWRGEGRMWTAGYMMYDDWTKQKFGSTPEEAVARLWLELNKK